MSIKVQFAGSCDGRDNRDLTCAVPGLFFPPASGDRDLPQHGVLDEDFREQFRIQAKKLFLESDMSPYCKLMAYKENYSEEKFFRTEMYALLAEFAYTDDLTIPTSLRPFYQGILSDQILGAMSNRH